MGRHSPRRGGGGGGGPGPLAPSRRPPMPYVHLGLISHKGGKKVGLALPVHVAVHNTPRVILTVDIRVEPYIQAQMRTPTS